MATDAIAGNATIEDVVARQRADLEFQGNDILKLRNGVRDGMIPPRQGEDRQEVLANLTLAYRHVEDARMRLGKVFQALNGGVSNSDR